MSRIVCGFGLTVLILVSLIGPHIVELGGSGRNDIGFVVGTCWPQIYDPEPNVRLEAMMIDSENLDEMHAEWRKCWAEEK